MRRAWAFALAVAALVALASSTSTTPAAGDKSLRPARVRHIRQLSFEFVGQFQNSPPGVTPATHVHYGYLSYIRGVSTFRAGPENETTALFTFFADATTLRVIPNGPLRIITRVGKLTIYRGPSKNGNFAKPDTFRDGTPIAVGEFRQQVVTNTVTGSFTTFHQVTITSTRPFRAGREKLQLGRVGQTFTIGFSGQGNMPGPPSGYFGGYGVSG
jgi:hypothetical protein